MTTTTTTKNAWPEVAWRKDIGMYSIDRPVSSCRWATEFCSKNCYVRKFYLLGRITSQRDSVIEKFWYSLTGEKLRALLSRKRKQTRRIRLAARGEILSTLEDIFKLQDICKKNPDTTFWLPTRSWRDPGMRANIERLLFPLRNLRLLASVDPSNTVGELRRIKDQGWSTYYFGSNDYCPTDGNAYKCPKTWQGAKGYCSRCPNGCFSRKQVHVWSKMSRTGKKENSSWEK